MKKAFVLFLLVLLSLSACMFETKTTVNGQNVSDLPYRFYAVLNEEYYAFLKPTMTEEEFAEKICDITLQNFLTHYIILEEVSKKSLVLSSQDAAYAEADARDFRNAHPDFDCTDEERKDLFSVYYFQEMIRETMPVTEEEVVSAFHDRYAVIQYVCLLKTDENGDLFDTAHLDNLRGNAYNIRDLIVSGDLTVEDAVQTFSEEYVRDVSSLSSDKQEQATEKNRILAEKGILVSQTGELLPKEHTFLFSVEAANMSLRMRIGDVLVVEDASAFYIIVRLDQSPYIDLKREEMTSLARSEKFESWLDEQLDKIEYSVPDSLIKACTSA